jgi:hypothetical protein
LTAPRNFTTKKTKKGHIDSVLFSAPGYLDKGDPYQDSGKFKMRAGKHDGHKEAGHDLAFKPAKDI